ncbi:MAG: redoxin domain-containing protein [Bacteroidales bacterium]|nr:redoxin domain-containing protein [Bacteroidales bacterium]
MKKLSLLLIAMALGLGVKAQCPLTTAIDFTATDCHGTEVHLFDILDGGQYVLIDFFYYNCGACNTTAPMMVQSYQSFGCNMHDVFYMEISDRDSDAVCQNWVANYGVEYPTISGAAGGSTINDQYLIGAFPTVILIRPDRQIVIQDLWPINNVQSVITALENQGVEQHSCVASPEVAIGIDLVTETEVTVTFTPNEDCASYAYTIATESEIQEWMSIAGLALPEYLWNYGIPGSETLSHTFNGLTPEIEYTIYAVPADLDGNLGEMAQETVTTTSGGSSETMPDFTGTDLNGNEIHLYDILDAGQAVLINFFLTGDPFSEDVMDDMTEAYRLYGCNGHDVFVMEISPNGHNSDCQAWAEQFGVEYPTISRDGGGNTIVQSIPVALYPAIMLIRPDHTIAKRDIYPPTLEYIIDAMNIENYQQAPCYEETLTFSTDNMELPYISGAEITVYNNTSEDAVIHRIQETNDWNNFCLITFFINGIEYGNCPDGLEIALPKGDSLSMEMLCLMVGKNDPDYIEDLVTLSSNLPDASFTVMIEHAWSIDENKVSTTLRPNPANNVVTLKGEDLGTVRVYNSLGQKVDELKAEGNELQINTTRYSNGVYFVKTGETALRFVVTH